jgi:hypothetical protein
MVLVKEDTLSITEKVERLIGHIRLSSPQQIARLKDTKAEYADLIKSVKALLD